MRSYPFPLAAIVLLIAVGCDSGKDDTAPPEADTDADADSDTDTDADSDVDTDADSDTADDSYEATWCWMLAPVDGGAKWTQLALLSVDMTTGGVSEVDRYDVGVYKGFSTAGMARSGDTLVFAAEDGHGGRWMRLDTSGRAFERCDESTYARSVGITGSEYVAVRKHGLEMGRYPSFETLCTDEPTATTSARRFTRLAVAGSEVYGLWHSTDHAEVVDLKTGDLIRSVSLEDWDGWVEGVSMAGGKLHLLSYLDQWKGEQRVESFDPVTGKLIEAVVVPDMGYFILPSGLWCEVSVP